MGSFCKRLSLTGAIRDFHVPLIEVRRVRCLLSTGSHVCHERVVESRDSHLRYLLVRAYKPFPLVQFNDLYTGSHVFTVPTI
jgi:hypothetical protein